MAENQKDSVKKSFWQRNLFLIIIILIIIVAGGGYLYKNNSVDDLVINMKKFNSDQKKNKYNKILLAKKNVKNFTIFNHYKLLKNILEHKQ